MLPRLLAALVLVAAGFLAAFFIGRATADSAEPNSTLRAGPSASVIVLPRKSPSIALPAKAGALPPLVQPPATTAQQPEQRASPTATQPTQAQPTIGVG